MCDVMSSVGSVMRAQQLLRYTHGLRSHCAATDETAASRTCGYRIKTSTRAGASACHGVFVERLLRRTTAIKTCCLTRRVAHLRRGRFEQSAAVSIIGISIQRCTGQTMIDAYCCSSPASSRLQFTNFSAAQISVATTKSEWDREGR